MTIPHLKSPQDWKKPVYVKGKTKSLRDLTGGKKSYSISHRYLNPPRKKQRLKKILSIAVPITILLFLLSGIGLMAGLAWISKDLPSPDKVINRNLTVSTKIYDRSGKTVLYDIHGDIKRTLIDLEQVPDHVINATLAAEDRNFYTHKGFSLTGIIRSIVLNTFTGSKVGGSTLTQQFVKNAVLTTEKTYIRKIKELLISYQLENKFSKDEILHMYFNEIPYGSVIYGVEAAAQSFFGKSAKDLTIAEGAILAAIPKAPTYYSPYGNNRDRLIGRQRYIIDEMLELGYITQPEAELSKQEKLIFKPLQESIIAPHFVMYIKEILSQEYGENFIAQEGLKVYTSLDLDLQKIAEQAVKDGVEAKGQEYNFSNASLVAIDPKTGQILAMVGSVDYFNEDIDGQVNVSLRPRQPGSSLKPIIYMASFIKGLRPETILYDVVTDFDATNTKPYEPKNYDLKEHGPISIRQALQGSLNIPAVKATYLVGIDEIADLAQKLGYTTLQDKDRFGLSIVLGGAEVKLVEHVNAYATLADGGNHHELAPILRIEDKTGRTLYEYKDKSKKVVEPEYVNMITNVLSDDAARGYAFGTGGVLTLPGRPVAAKTGTTNEYRDAWTVGFTPSLVAGVWAGNNDNEAMKAGGGGSTLAGPIWNQFMREALKDTPVEYFPDINPEDHKTGKPILDGQEAAEIEITIDTMSGKLATQFTPEETTQKIKIKEVHNILYYINKDDILGDQPSNPESEPQFNKWEEAVIRWAKEEGFDPNENQEITDIPTDYDDIHLEKDQPNLIIITPLPNQTITDNNLTIDITASAPRGIKQVEYYLDNKLVLNKNNTDNVTLNLASFVNGEHTLTIKVKDDLKNTATQSRKLNFKLPQIQPELNWTQPNQNSNLNFPVTLKASLTHSERVKKIDLYYQPISGGVETYINYITSPQAQISAVWDEKPEPGSYEVFANIFDIQGKKYPSPKLQVNID